jgi:hypothetical protein
MSLSRVLQGAHCFACGGDRKPRCGGVALASLRGASVAWSALPARRVRPEGASRSACRLTREFGGSGQLPREGECVPGGGAGGACTVGPKIWGQLVCLLQSGCARRKREGCVRVLLASSVRPRSALPASGVRPGGTPWPVRRPWCEFGGSDQRPREEGCVLGGGFGGACTVGAEVWRLFASALGTGSCSPVTSAARLRASCGFGGVGVCALVTGGASRRIVAACSQIVM